MENRFLEMDSQLKLLRRNGRADAFSFGKSRSAFAGSFTAVDYVVPGIIGPIQQPSGMVCWATVSAMMINWRRQQSQSIETAIGAIGQNWLLKFRNNQGLAASEKVPFLNAAGFQFEYPQNLSIDGWEQMLRRYGPIWVTTDEDPSLNFAIHARIMSGIRGDGTAANTFLTITDPAQGNQYQERFADFLRKYEDEVHTAGTSWSGRIQIVHWPEGEASTSKSFSNERTRSMTISSAGVAMIKRFEGFRGKLYNDPVGHCSVGYGELVHKGNCNGDASEQSYRTGISEENAAQLLVNRLHAFEGLINDSVTVELNQNQFDSLVSFSYNVGSGNFKQSTLLRLLNGGNYGSVSTELKKWTKGRKDGQLVDLPGLVTRRNEEAALFAATTATAQSFGYDDYSRPFYDTGEHSILGQYIDSLVNAPIATVAALSPATFYNINGVPFTYGQLMTMGDFYESYTKLSTAPVAELNKLKDLIIRSENLYKNAIFKMTLSNAKDPEDEWNKATGGRYLDLAAVNNSHFAPPPAESVFKSSTKPNNKSTWEYYHTEAIKKARLGRNSNDLIEALKINAFGDHFLTDAFSAGHLVNKELMIERFKIMVLDKGKVDSDGTGLLDRIAKKVFTGAVAAEFGKYQTSDTRYKVNGFIDDANMFKTLLIGILEKKPDKIANLFVKAIHDELNKYNNKTGVPVTNALNQHWNLTGDGTLNKDNIKYIQEAVKQSVENISDSITNPATAVSVYIKRVWDHVPVSSHAETKGIIDTVIKDYSDLRTDKLVNKGVELIKEQYADLISELIKEKAIEPRQSGPLHPLNHVGNWINDLAS